MLHNDKRTSPRRVLPVAVKIRRAARPTLLAQGVDVSTKGMCITAEEQLPPGTFCTVEFVLGFKGVQKRFELPALVVYSLYRPSSSWTMGLSFKGVAADQVVLLDGYVRHG